MIKGTILILLLLIALGLVSGPGYRRFLAKVWRIITGAR